MATTPPFANDPRTQRRLARDQARMQRYQLRSLRRSSVIGPLLLIALGILFFLVQIGRLHLPELWLGFAHWWPLLLVVVGLIRLAEWFLDQRNRRNGNGVATPQRVLGPGVGLLLGLLVIAGVASTFMRNQAVSFPGSHLELNEDNLQRFFGDKHESTQTLQEACPPGTEVTINNPRGSITLSGASEDATLRATANNEVFTRSDSDAATKARQIALHVERNGDQLILSVPSVEGGRADLTITLPPNTPVTTTANHGDLQIRSLHAPLSVTANHGDIDLSDLYGPIQAHINNADSSLSAHNLRAPLDVEGRSLDLTLSEISAPVSLHGDFFGTTHLERIAAPIAFHTSRADIQMNSLNGELEISQNADLTASQLVGPTIINTRNRNITLDRVSGPLTVTNRNGSVTATLVQPLGALNIENRNGEVDVTLPTDAQFTLQAETSNADLENDFGLPLSESGDRPKLTGTVGQGGPHLQISTSQGDLSIHKGSLAPLTPLPSSAGSARDALKEGNQALREARKARDQALQEAQKETQKALSEARRETDKALQDAQKQADNARRQARKAQKDSNDSSSDEN